jgi:OmpA-OmpF porin, OOP family
MKKLKYLIAVFFALLINQHLYSQVDSTIAPFNYKNLGPSVNSEDAELNPVISANESKLFFARERRTKNYVEQYIWSSQRDAGNNWLPAVKEAKPFNTMPINSIADLINDGNTVLIKGNYQNKKYLPRGFSLISKVNGKWGEPQGLNIEEYETMDKGLFNNASISFDKKVLLFSFSQTEGGKDNNLYISFLKDGNDYSKPVKLPEPLNLEGHSEFAPRINADAKKIYFSSDRPGGFGSNDIYVSERLDDSWMKWSKPANMSNIVNTSGRDSYFSIDSTGEYAYIISDINSLGKSDIYQVKLIMPHTIKGVITSQRTGKTLSGSVQIISEKANDILKVEGEGYTKISKSEGRFVFKSSSEGYYDRFDTIVIKRNDKIINLVHALTKKPEQRKIKLIVKEDNGKLISGRIHITNHSDIDFEEDMKQEGLYETQLPENMTYTVSATKVEEQNKLSKTLKVPHAEDGDTAIPTAVFIFKAHQIFNFINLYFKTNSAIPEDSSYKFMDLIVEYMTKHPAKRIMISAHTDDVGDNTANMNLSKQRAATVKKYLISKGIDEKRLQSAGYGETKPVQKGKTPEIRALNRRVEFELIE